MGTWGLKGLLFVWTHMKGGTRREMVESANTIRETKKDRTLAEKRGLFLRKRGKNWKQEWCKRGGGGAILKGIRKGGEKRSPEGRGLGWKALPVGLLGLHVFEVSEN